MSREDLHQFGAQTIPAEFSDTTYPVTILPAQITNEMLRAAYAERSGEYVYVNIAQGQNGQMQVYYGFGAGHEIIEMALRQRFPDLAAAPPMIYAQLHGSDSEGFRLVFNSNFGLQTDQVAAIHAIVPTLPPMVTSSSLGLRIRSAKQSFLPSITFKNDILQVPPYPGRLRKVES